MFLSGLLLLLAYIGLTNGEGVAPANYELLGNLLRILLHYIGHLSANRFVIKTCERRGSMVHVLNLSKNR